MKLSQALFTATVCLCMPLAACINYGEDEPKVGGESHWLQECTADGDCGDLGPCDCGRCVVQCASDSDCGGLPGAICGVQTQECGRFCVPECASDADCSDRGLLCLDGACVAESTCGSSRCALGLVCCNDSCGICAAPDEACIQIGCEDASEDDNGSPDDPNAAACGDGFTCAPGLECCNPSCHICVEPAGVCTTQACR
jgi:hypothetical protein